MFWFGERYSNGMFYGTLSASISSCSIAGSLRRMPGPNCSHVSIMSLWCGRSVIVVSWWRHHHNMTAPPNIVICIFERRDAVNFPPTLLADSQRHKGLGHLSESKPGISFNIFPLINSNSLEVSHISKNECNKLSPDCLLIDSGC